MKLWGFENCQLAILIILDPITIKILFSQFYLCFNSAGKFLKKTRPFLENVDQKMPFFCELSSLKLVVLGTKGTYEKVLESVRPNGCRKYKTGMFRVTQGRIPGEEFPSPLIPPWLRATPQERMLRCFISMGKEKHKNCSALR